MDIKSEEIYLIDEIIQRHNKLKHKTCKRLSTEFFWANKLHTCTLAGLEKVPGPKSATAENIVMSFDFCFW